MKSQGNAAQAERIVANSEHDFGTRPEGLEILVRDGNERGGEIRARIRGCRPSVQVGMRQEGFPGFRRSHPAGVRITDSREAHGRNRGIR